MIDNLETIWILRCITCNREIPLEQTHTTGDRGRRLYHGPDDRNRIAEHVGHNMLAIEMGRPKGYKGDA